MEMKDEMFNDLLQSMQEADLIVKGSKKPSRSFEIAAPDIQEIRSNLGVSQQDFAFMIGVPVNTVQNWEQDRRHPRGPALALLTMFKNNPQDAFNILHARHLGGMA